MQVNTFLYILGPKAEIKLNINGQAILQKTVNAGTIEKSEVGKAYDYNTHEWHDEPILAKEKVEVQSTKVNIRYKDNSS